MSKGSFTGYRLMPSASGYNPFKISIGIRIGVLNNKTWGALGLSILHTRAFRKMRYFALLLCVIAVTLTVIKPIILPALLVMCALVYMIYKPKYTAALITVWLAVQNFLIPLFYRFIGGSPNYWTIIVGSSEISALLMILFMLWPMRGWGTSTYRDLVLGVDKRIMLFIIFYGLSVIFMLLLHPGNNLMQAVLSSRLVLTPVLFFVLGIVFSWRERDCSRYFIKTIIYVTLIGAALSIVDAVFLGGAFWRALDIGQYWMQVKHVPAYEVYQGLPGNYYEHYGRFWLRRAVSIYGDPLAAAYSMAIGFSVLLFQGHKFLKKRVWIISLAIVLAGIALTYTRAAFLMILIEFVAFYIYTRKRGLRINVIAILAMVAVLVGISYKVLESTLNMTNGSAMIHMKSLMQIPFLVVHPWGFGVGTNGPEGAYLQLWWQYGMIPSIFFILSVCFILVSRWFKIDGNAFWLRGLTIALMVAGLFSAEIFTDTGCGAGWILLGMMTFGYPRNGDSVSLMSGKRGHKGSQDHLGDQSIS